MDPHHRASNVDRFSGFAALYDTHRPQTPPLVIDILTRYLGHRPTTVVDLGCGTGLSSGVWLGHADQGIGVEPNADMRAIAESKAATWSGAHAIRFVPGYSHATSLAPASADIVTCSQSFHWMEPVSTLAEVARILVSCGIFAAYDCDWPPTCDWPLEAAFRDLVDAADRLVAERQPDAQRAHKWPKEQHLANLDTSGHFRFVKELVFHHHEEADANRFVGLALSQGGLQTVLKQGWTDLDDAIEQFRQTAQARMGTRTESVVFHYRMRLGIK